jgi:hypothetical protein
MPECPKSSGAPRMRAALRGLVIMEQTFATKASTCPDDFAG